MQAIRLGSNYKYGGGQRTITTLSSVRLQRSRGVNSLRKYFSLPNLCVNEGKHQHTIIIELSSNLFVAVVVLLYRIRNIYIFSGSRCACAA